MIYHIFNYRIQGKWYRDSATYSEAQFERIMEALDWKLPVHMQIYHYGSPDRKYYDLTNAIVVKRPVLSLDPMALAVSPQENVLLYMISSGKSVGRWFTGWGVF